MEASTSRQNDKTLNSICELCKNNIAKYTCPRCNIALCSLNCYKDEFHKQCSENFYRECVMTELENNEINAESKQKMFDILNRIHNQEDWGENIADEDVSESDSDNDNYTDLSQRLADVDLDNAEEVWSKLNNDEKQEFESLLNSGKIAQLIPTWTAWWELTSKIKIQVLDEPEDCSYQKDCPKVINVPDFKTMMRKDPSTDVKFNILNILAAYVCTLRIFSGDHYGNLPTSLYLLSSLSNNLTINKNYNQIDSAIDDVLIEMSECNFIELTDTVDSDVLRADLRKVIEGPSLMNKKFYIQSALSDIHTMIKDSKSKKSNNGGKFTKKFNDDISLEIPKTKLNMYLKKIIFYLSYVNSFGLEIKI